MPLSIRTGISNQTAGTSKSSTTSAIPQIPSLQVGKVMGVVTTKNTPSPKQFEKVGGFDSPGTIFYLDYNKSKNIDPKIANPDDYLDRCDIAKPLFPQFCYYPLLGELVYIIELPSPASQIVQSAPEKYYVNSINLWNDSQVNAQTANKKAPLGKTFLEDSNIRNILNYEGDHIIQGRKGNSIRFGTTVRVASNRNEWSDIGLEGYPITIISNGHKYSKDKEFYIEQINEDASSLYLTTNQIIPLKVEVKDPLNPITLPESVGDYSNSQAILTAGRVVLNSKFDEVMIFASTNVEISTNNYINLNGGRVYINVKGDAVPKGPNPKIILGTRFDNTPASEPLLLGTKTGDFLLSLISALDAFALSLTATSTNASGSPLAKVQGSAEALQAQLKPLYDKIETLKSNTTFTI
jgi:hypothetical protein